MSFVKDEKMVTYNKKILVTIREDFPVRDKVLSMCSLKKFYENPHAFDFQGMWSILSFKYKV